MALKANLNVLECLYSPIVEQITLIGEELLQLRDSFLSKLVFQTYSGYVASQFNKMQTDIRNHGEVKWKHVMHLLRLLMSGISVLTERQVLVEVGGHRERLLAIKRGEVPFEEANRWRKQLTIEFQSAFEKTELPDRPDYELTEADMVFHETQYLRLVAELEDAQDRSSLPEAPSSRAALNDLLLRVRLAT